MTGQHRPPSRIARGVDAFNVWSSRAIAVLLVLMVVTSVLDLAGVL